MRFLHEFCNPANPDIIIRGYNRMTDIESRFFIMYESEKAFLKVADALNKIDCTRFTFTREEIKRMFEDGKCIKFDSFM